MASKYGQSAMKGKEVWQLYTKWTAERKSQQTTTSPLKLPNTADGNISLPWPQYRTIEFHKGFMLNFPTDFQLSKQWSLRARERASFGVCIQALLLPGCVTLRLWDSFCLIIPGSFQTITILLNFLICGMGI